ncbi:hypothetical protein M378DRAFT_79669 [Amanita muscaria Koide BX008]|uniref:CWF21 domain-containing protein n=1 Tax=Amanita muscaria (strain Koide BX008) TaxID=946122 RepID=A0A0C2WP46_AMAMK|nr:hypothetical protein M378DRAFT_79669 [Amanita muscaria Koide BX008]
MYNGIGLATPRGSGTNGYVVRNISVLRKYESSRDRQSAWNAPPPKHREPDKAILEHERKRKVEVKCLECSFSSRKVGKIDEDEVEEQVALREKLLKTLAAFAPAPKSLKSSDIHALAAAQKSELDRIARVLGTTVDYQVGDAFDRENQEDRARMAEQKARWE